LVEGEGDSFTAGGKTFKTGAEYNEVTGQITVYGANRYTNSAQIKDTLAHEVGHSLEDKWFSEAHEQWEKTASKHPKWFDDFGDPKPEFKTQFAKASPLAVTRTRFFDAWDAGEDGITQYSKAWAKDGNWSETFAEMTSVYLVGGKSEVMKLARRNGAAKLGSAFVDAMENLQ